MEKGRIKSFTLIEMVLTMMLAAVIIGMAYTAFTIMTRLYIKYNRKNLAHANVRMFKQVIDRDIERASLISLEQGQLYFKDSIGEVPLKYSIGPGYLIRIHHGVADTFTLKNMTLSVSFESREAATGPLDELQFRFEHEKKTVSFSSTKHYTATELFNYQDSLWNR